MRADVVRVAVDKGKCIGSGKCNFLAEEVFGQDDDGVVLLLTETPGEELREAIAEAVSECPAEAISMPR